MHVFAICSRATTAYSMLAIKGVVLLLALAANHAVGESLYTRPNSLSADCLPVTATATTFSSVFPSKFFLSGDDSMDSEGVTTVRNTRDGCSCMNLHTETIATLEGSEAFEKAFCDYYNGSCCIVYDLQHSAVGLLRDVHICTQANQSECSIKKLCGHRRNLFRVCLIYLGPN